jgi:hypothetical protein
LTCKRGTALASSCFGSEAEQSAHNAKLNTVTEQQFTKDMRFTTLPGYVDNGRLVAVRLFNPPVVAKRTPLQTRWFPGE